MGQHADDIEVRELEHGFIYKRLYEGQIVVYQPTVTSRAAVDVWERMVWQDISTWEPAQPFLAMHDFRAIGLTPYSRARGEVLLKQIPPSVSGRHSFVLSRSVLGMGLRQFGANSFKRLCPALVPGFFHNETDALAFLLQALKS